MSKKDWMLIALVLALASVYVVCFTGWFRPKPIHVSHTSRPVRFGARPGSSATILSFSLGNPYELTEIKVVPLAALQTNPLARPVWHLVSDSGSDPVDHFVYGERINGLEPAIAGTRPEPLQAGVSYRLFVRAGSSRGWHDFEAGPAAGGHISAPPP